MVEESTTAEDCYGVGDLEVVAADDAESPVVAEDVE